MNIIHGGFSPRAAFVLATLAFPAFSAHASTVTAGFASTGVGGGTFFVSGSDFSMGGASAHTSYTGPCAPTECIAPGTYSFFDGLSSESTPSGMSGSYTVGGLTYNYSCNQGTACGGGIDFSGVLTLPDFGLTPPLTFTLTTFFTSTGGIGGVGTPQNPAPSLSFSGSGIATITLHEIRPGSYQFSSANYSFTAVPEPMSGALAGIGLLLTGIGGLIARRSRNKQRQHIRRAEGASVVD